MDHDLVQLVLIAALAAVGLVILVPLIVTVVHKLFFFDRPELYEWQQARRQLHRLDQGRVIWATNRQRPAGRAGLAEAQLAYARYRQDVARRALRRGRRRGRLAAMIWNGVVAAGYAALAGAATQSQLRILGIVAAGSFAGNALTIALAPRSSRRQIERMARLQAEIERAPELSSQGR